MPPHASRLKAHDYNWGQSFQMHSLIPIFSKRREEKLGTRSGGKGSLRIIGVNLFKYDP